MHRTVDGGPIDTSCSGRVVTNSNDHLVHCTDKHFSPSKSSKMVMKEMMKVIIRKGGTLMYFVVLWTMHFSKLVYVIMT